MNFTLLPNVDLYLLRLLTAAIAMVLLLYGLIWAGTAMTYTPLIEGFPLGIIATPSIFAGIFFLRFWRDTRDSLFWRLLWRS